MQQPRSNAIPGASPAGYGAPPVSQYPAPPPQIGTFGQQPAAPSAPKPATSVQRQSMQQPAGGMMGGLQSNLAQPQQRPQSQAQPMGQSQPMAPQTRQQNSQMKRRYYGE